MKDEMIDVTEETGSSNRDAPIGLCHREEARQAAQHRWIG
jgi:hypothetical protein